MRLDHPIFQAPLRVDVVIDEDHPYGDGDDRKGTWLVHTGEFGDGCDVGMVSDGHGFEDSPDCERISGGVNSKGPRAVAIGREANMLQWGFYGAPDRMTESAKRAFLNAIVYMKQFEGQAPLVQKRGQSRTWLPYYIDSLAKMKPEERGKRGKDDYASYLLRNFPSELTAGDFDVAKLRAWYEANMEYIGRGRDEEALNGPLESGMFALDADLQQLQLSNRAPAFLDWLLKRFDESPADPLALRLAGRYLERPHGKTAASAVAWIQANRKHLFFSDTGGFRWFVDTNAQRAAGAKAPAKADAGR